MGFLLVTANSLLAITPSRIRINAPAMSFAAFLAQADWWGLFTDGESAVAGLILLILSFGMLVYSATASPRVRVSALVAALALPPVFLCKSPSEFALWFVKMPYMAVSGTVQALLGYGNGQFYGDGPFMIGAIGWWVVFSLLLLLAEIAGQWRHSKSAELPTASTSAS